MKLNWKEFGKTNEQKMRTAINGGFGGRLVEFLNFVELNGFTEYINLSEGDPAFDFESVLHGDMDSYRERVTNNLWTDYYILGNPILLKNPNTDMTVLVTCPYFVIYDQEELATWCAAFNICCKIYDFKKQGGALAVFGTKDTIEYTTRCIPEEYMVEYIETIP